MNRGRQTQGPTPFGPSGRGKGISLVCAVLAIGLGALAVFFYVSPATTSTTHSTQFRLNLGWITLGESHLNMTGVSEVHSYGLVSVNITAVNNGTYGYSFPAMHCTPSTHYLYLGANPSTDSVFVPAHNQTWFILWFQIADPSVAATPLCLFFAQQGSY